MFIYLLATISKMKLNIILYLTLFHFLSLSYCAQGFYNNETVFVNQTTLSNESICEIQGYSDYEGISNRKLTNFVLNYEVNEQGIIIKRKYWKSPFIFKKIKGRKKKAKPIYSEKIMAVYLVKDSLIILNDQIYYQQCSQSSTYLFDQEGRNRNELMEEMTKQIQIDSLRPIKNGLSLGNQDSRQIINTLILGHQLSIPRFLLKSNDSICYLSDSVTSYYRSGIEKRIFCITDSSTIRIEWLNNEGNVWRTYLFNQEGFLDTHTQGIFTTKYFYKNKLHVRTENYQKDDLMHTTTFEYKTNCG
ncbi:MAG: hypothetical protein ACI9N1_002798 [Flavobacteriales bacterium]